MAPTGSVQSVGSGTRPHIACHHLRRPKCLVCLHVYEQTIAIDMRQEGSCVVDVF